MLSIHVRKSSPKTKSLWIDLNNCLKYGKKSEATQQKWWSEQLWANGGQPWATVSNREQTVSYREPPPESHTFTYWSRTFTVRQPWADREPPWANSHYDFLKDFTDVILGSGFAQSCSDRKSPPSHGSKLNPLLSLMMKRRSTWCADYFWYSRWPNWGGSLCNSTSHRAFTTSLFS